MRHRDGSLDVQEIASPLQERQNVLQARLNNWYKIQAVYIPAAQILRGFQHGEEIRAGGHDAENAKLYLPSQLPPNLWSTGCMPGLREIELKLRIAQISDSLEQLKQQLCVYSGLVHYKISQVSGPGQKSNTRARNLLVRLWEKILRCAERYRASRAALKILDPTGGWQEYFRPLLESDVQGPNGKSPDDVVAPMSKQSKRLRGTGEGVRQLSWIWRVRRPASAEGSEGTAEADLDRCE